MRKWILALLLGGGIVVLALVIYPVMLLGGAFNSCATTVYQRAPAPDGEVEARAQMTDCGATTGFSRVVWVKHADEEDAAGSECRALVLDGEPTVQFSWNERTLNIQHDAAQSDVGSASGSCIGHKIQITRIIN